MHAFSKKQEEFKLGGNVVGGQPGVNPTLAFGTLFYGKDYKKLDGDALRLARERLESYRQMCSATGIQGIPDLYIKDSGRVEPVIQFINDNWDGMFSIDISDSNTRIEALKHLSKEGLLGRTVYNSLNLGMTEDEYDALSRHTPESAVLLAFNPKDTGVDGKLEILETGSGLVKAKGEAVGILELAEKLGINKRLVDTAATPFGNNASEAFRALPVIKSMHGLPVGCAIHNTLESWAWMKEYRKAEPRAYVNADVAVNCLASAYMADFIFYGPIESCTSLFPALAFTDKMIAEGAATYFGHEINPVHPYTLLE